MGNTAIIIISVFAGISLFLFCRELWCWYWKVNESIENQQKIIILLQELINSTEKAIPQSSSAKINYADYLDKHILVAQKDGSQISGKIVQSLSSNDYLALFTDGSVKKIKLETIKNIELV